MEVTGAADRSGTRVSPYLISAGEDGTFSLGLRETRFNSQNYPVVTVTTVDETFATAAAARAFAKKTYGAGPGEFEVKGAKAKGR